MREKLIELLQSAPADIMGNRGVGVLADHLIANGVTIQKWIPVSERLPKKEDARIMDGYLPAIQRDKKPNIWKWTEVAKYPEYFTHWMPLPEMPKEE